jgi:hypothetical protein
MKCERHFTGIVFSPAEQDDNFLSEIPRRVGSFSLASVGQKKNRLCGSVANFLSALGILASQPPSLSTSQLLSFRVGLCVSVANSFSCNLFFALSHRGVGPMPYGPEAAISAVNISFQP